jgi:histidinol dehydrogenase
VERIAVATPRPSEAMLATADELGIDELYSMGGAQAIAAFAHGTETIAPVAKIVGPGNRWVTEAKLLVSARVATDLPAGPSEVLVIADQTADPDACAADLLAQSEHGPDGTSILVTTSIALAEAVDARVRGRARVELVGSLEEALARANELAPEHLELLVEDPDALAAGVRNAGAVFLGTSAVVGDYAAGSNHVLPTGGLARGTGGLGLEAFLKPVEFVRATADALSTVRPTVEAFAALEGLPLHAETLAART